MICEECGQVSDWVGDGSNWTHTDESSVSARPLLECTECGNHQHAR